MGFESLLRLKEQWLRNVIGLKLPNGLPSYDTVRRVLGILDPKQFQSAFIRWIEQELDIPEGSYVSLDGKSLRGVFKMSVLNVAAHFKPKFAFCKLSIICTFSLRCERA